MTQISWYVLTVWAVHEGRLASVWSEHLKFLSAVEDPLRKKDPVTAQLKGQAKKENSGLLAEDLLLKLYELYIYLNIK